MLDVFLVPFLAGLLVSRIYRSRSGKWLACLPPLFVRSLTYLYMYWFVYNDGQDFFYHLNLYYWGPAVILVVEVGNLGGILGDVLAGAYGSKPMAQADKEA
jgi:predicted Na+-dependent transporter